MTAEVAVLNNIGVALAADSAATISATTKKIFTSADKLFNLAIDAPVGIMVFGNASLFNLPWETIIKDYRKQLGNTKFPKLIDYSDDFLTYLKESKKLFSEEQQETVSRYVIDLYLQHIVSTYEKEVEKFEENSPTLSAEDAKRIFNDVLDTELENPQRFKPFEDLPANFEKLLRENYKNLFQEAKRKKLENFDISSGMSRKINNLLIRILTTSMFDGCAIQTGVVIAGFGEEEYFPCLIELSISTILLDKLLYRKVRETATGNSSSAQIIPFAQSEMVYSYLLGIEPRIALEIQNYSATLFGEIANIIATEVEESEKKRSDLISKLTAPTGIIQAGLAERMEELQNQYAQKVMGMVQHLPKDQLAEMAESLVNLTSYKRKISDEDETVGGPIDVAVITKSDGFIWVKRKHYFSPDLNPRFMVRYNKEAKNGQERI